jgi:hypothetical protein
MPLTRDAVVERNKASVIVQNPHPSTTFKIVQPEKGGDAMHRQAKHTQFRPLLGLIALMLILSLLLPTTAVSLQEPVPDGGAPNLLMAARPIPPHLRPIQRWTCCIQMN